MADERDLLREARALDESALGVIFDTYYPLLYRHIYYHVHHQETAQDLTAEVFARMLAQFAEGRGPERHLRAWLYRVAHNLVIDESRRRVHRDHDPLDEQTVSPEEGVEAQTQAAILWQQARGALEELTPKQQTVIILKFLEGYDNKEISRILEMRVGAVKALQHRGLASMRRHLALAGVIEEDLS
jgi:RNA polymerase sigma-70 factor (ECF subfamily)